MKMRRKKISTRLMKRMSWRRRWKIRNQDYSFFLSTSEYNDTIALKSLMDIEGISVKLFIKCCCFSSKSFTFCYK